MPNVTPRSRISFAPLSLVVVLATAALLAIGCSKQSTLGPSGPAVPAIVSFSAAPGAITPGSTAVLSWIVTGATRLEIDRGVGGAPGPSQSVSPSSTTTYTLTAGNNVGSVTATATVTVGGS